MPETALREIPPRCVVFAPRNLSRLLHHRSVFASLAASGRQIVAVTHGEAPKRDHAGVLEPMLMKLRLEHTPEHLDAPLTLGRDEVTPERLRRLEVDEVVVLARRWADPRVAAAAGVSRRWGYRGGLAGVFLRPRVPRPDLDGRHATDDGRELLAAMGVEWVEAPTLEVPKVWRRAGPERLAKAKLDLDAPLVGVHLGDDDGGGRAWPGESFEELVRRLRKRRPNTGFVILATERELWQSVLLYERTAKIHPVIGPDLALDGIAAVLARLDLVIASDSWLLQLAAAVGTSTVGLFPRDARRRAPRGPRHRAIERRRLAKIGIEEVLDPAVESLDSARSDRENDDS